MSPRIYCCVIRGYQVRDHGTPTKRWLKEFRAIYSTPNGYFISGVGHYDDIYGDLEAPSDPAKRCDDEDYDPRLTEVFHVKIRWDGSHAFVSHDVCWKLLEEAFRPDDISLRRFLDVCESLPLPLGFTCFHWGHTYGGIYDFDRESAYPWECRLVREPSNPEALQHATENPYDVPELTKLLTMTAQQPHDPTAHYPEKISNDPFGKLPWEIRESIANHLPTRDALSLRSSSRSFIPLLSSPTFWASRFQSGADRGFLFEKRNTAEPRNWLSLYRMTSYGQSPPGLKNRRRIWELIEFIIQLLNLRSTYEYDDDLTTQFDASSDSESIITATAEIVQPSPEDGTYPVFKAGCRVFRRQQSFIPHDLIGIAFSFVGFGDHGHLCGLCFKSANGKDAQLGYSSAQDTVLYNVENLRGFVLSIDPRGIRALQVVDGNGARSPWFGYSENTPVTERLVAFDISKPVRVSIDGYKIISIAANRAEYRLGTPLAGSSPSLRTTALWYPSIPSSEMSLNEESFKDEALATGEYMPLHWAQFAGPKGAYLRHLIDISFSQFTYPATIKFQYNDGSIEPAHFGLPESQDFPEMTPNHIDGPGGEYIQSVQVATRRGICALKFVTNNGKVLECGTTLPPPPMPATVFGEPDSEPEPEAQFETLEIDPGTTITGFYAGQDPIGLSNFGIISEMIGPEELTQD